jgi:hypothetical protein
MFQYIEGIVGKDQSMMTLHFAVSAVAWNALKLIRSNAPTAIKGSAKDCQNRTKKP